MWGEQIFTRQSSRRVSCLYSKNYTLIAYSIVAYDSARPTYLETINVLMMSLKSELWRPSHPETWARENCHEATKRRQSLWWWGSSQWPDPGHPALPEDICCVLEEVRWRPGEQFVISSMLTNCPANRWEPAPLASPLIHWFCPRFLWKWVVAQLLADAPDHWPVSHHLATW